MKIEEFTDLDLSKSLTYLEAHLVYVEGRRDVIEGEIKDRIEDGVWKLLKK